MSEVKYTRGPWKAYEDGLDCWTVVDSDKEDVCHLACVGDESNARLIAAAPELLEALQCLMSHQSFQGDRYPNLDIWQKCQSAITKALGTENAN